MSHSIEHLIQQVQAIDVTRDAERLKNSFEQFTGLDESNIGFVDIINYLNVTIDAISRLNDKVNLLVELEQRRQEEDNG